MDIKELSLWPASGRDDQNAVSISADKAVTRLMRENDRGSARIDRCLSMVILEVVRYCTCNTRRSLHLYSRRTP